VNTFLIQYFENIVDYNFTANVELEFDEIAQGQKVWNQMLKEFYGPFHKQIETTLQTSERVKGERLLGVDPKSGKNLYVKIGRFGAMAQIGEAEDEEKPKFAGLKKGQSIESITLEEALALFDFPRKIGEYEGSELTVAIGRFGPYVKHNSAFYSIKKTDDPATITQQQAIELIEEKRKKEREKLIKSFEDYPEIQILNGRWGPYISKEKLNYKIPKGKDPKSLSLADCQEIIKESQAAPKKKIVHTRKK